MKQTRKYPEIKWEGEPRTIRSGFLVHPKYDNLMINRKGIMMKSSIVKDSNGEEYKTWELYKGFSSGYKGLYKSASIQSNKELVHRLVWDTWVDRTMAWRDEKGMNIDHIDGNGHNNKLDNLRHVTHQENCQNRFALLKPIKITNVKDGSVMYAESGIQAANMLNTYRYYISNALKQEKLILNKTYKLEYITKDEYEESRGV